MEKNEEEKRTIIFDDEKNMKMKKKMIKLK